MSHLSLIKNYQSLIYLHDLNLYYQPYSLSINSLIKWGKGRVEGGGRNFALLWYLIQVIFPVGCFRFLLGNLFLTAEGLLFHIIIGLSLYLPHPIVVHYFFNVLSHFSALVVKNLRWRNPTPPQCLSLSSVQSTFRLIFTLSMCEWKSNNVRMSSPSIHKIPIYSRSLTWGRN